MQTMNLNTANLSPQMQAILPVLENLQTADYDFLFNFLKTKTKKELPKVEKELPLSREEIAKKRLGFFKGGMTMSDDFGDDLGDEFWLGKDA